MLVESSRESRRFIKTRTNWQSGSQIRKKNPTRKLVEGRDHESWWIRFLAGIPFGRQRVFIKWWTGGQGQGSQHPPREEAPWPSVTWDWHQSLIPGAGTLQRAVSGKSEMDLRGYRRRPGSSSSTQPSEDAGSSGTPIWGWWEAVQGRSDGPLRPIATVGLSTVWESWRVFPCSVWPPVHFFSALSACL